MSRGRAAFSGEFSRGRGLPLGRAPLSLAAGCNLQPITSQLDAALVVANKLRGPWGGSQGKLKIKLLHAQTSNYCGGFLKPPLPRPSKRNQNLKRQLLHLEFGRARPTAHRSMASEVFCFTKGDPRRLVHVCATSH
eukprot:GHVT01088012.1.p1 GENE.GHVT01088012.1~~GHVT01088012.1.p1  ORF type:complete len:136 (+),score=14.16 GHVT01088012.1:1160-1567(+)